jgi:hypothetical protein
MHIDESENAVYSYWISNVAKIITDKSASKVAADSSLVHICTLKIAVKFSMRYAVTCNETLSILITA